MIETKNEKCNNYNNYTILVLKVRHMHESSNLSSFDGSRCVMCSIKWVGRMFKERNP